MGCGKSNIGYHLARYLGYEFLDTDRIIEAETGFRVQYLFALHGEQYFRDLETAWCAKTLPTAHRAIIATGGGLPVSETNQAYLKKHSYVIWLDVALETLKARFIPTEKRPLASQLEEKFIERLPIYQALADMRYDAGEIDRATHIKLVDHLKRALCA